MMTEQEVLARLQGFSVSRLRVCIQEEWVAPAQDKGGPLFDDVDLARLQLIRELNDLMDVNDAAVPIILSLVDQLNAARAHLHVLDDAITLQEAEVQDRIVAALTKVTR